MNEKAMQIQILEERIWKLVSLNISLEDWLREKDEALEMKEKELILKDSQNHSIDS